MRELAQKFRRATDLLGIPTDDLARSILWAMRQRIGDPIAALSSRRQSWSEAFGAISPTSGEIAGPELSADLERAFRAAWDQLENWGLIEPAPGSNGENGYVELTSKGKSGSDQADFERMRVRSLLKQEMLHPLLQGKPFEDFGQDHLGDAVFGAFKIVEIQLRSLCSEAESTIGQELVGRAFGRAGKLVDKSWSNPKREAIERLFNGALGVFRNPAAHSDPAYDEIREAMEEMMLASRLLRVVDSC